MTLRPTRNAEDSPHFPEVTVPGVGVAQVVLRQWLRVEKCLWEVVDGRMQVIVSVMYFRLWLPAAKQYWSYRVDAKNSVPPTAIVIYG